MIVGWGGVIILIVRRIMGVYDWIHVALFGRGMIIGGYI